MTIKSVVVKGKAGEVYFGWIHWTRLVDLLQEKSLDEVCSEVEKIALERLCIMPDIVVDFSKRKVIFYDWDDIMSQVETQNLCNENGFIFEDGVEELRKRLR